MFWGDEIHSLSVCVRASEQREQGYNSIIGCFRAENGMHIIQHSTRNTLVDLFSSLHVLSAWKQIAAVTAAICTQRLDTQDRIPNKWKELLRNKLVKSLSQAAEKYFRNRMRRRNCH